MPEPLKIRDKWDAVLTYDALSSHGPRPIFVGRQDLLDVIVGTICQPERRGTFLVSGYRGAGKTTLLIEAICQARDRLDRRKREQDAAALLDPQELLSLVLNASEVSASLAAPAPAATPTLQIGAQQLLTALIRTLRNIAQTRQENPKAGATNGSRPLPPALVRAIEDAYRKASAKEYSRTESAQTQQTETRTREVELKLNAADIFKGLTAITAVGALGVEAGAWLKGTMSGLHAVALGLGGVAVASSLASAKFSQTAKQERTDAISVKFDNSLQQLEGDLKDILVSLQNAKFRTVVVLEELDKLRDEDGQQLDAVIRYFKNLFTQAPALFFFVTDRAYYDFIAAEIRRARRQRSYAIQHTFFTHRLFVGRPTTADCLDYLESILLDPKAASDLDGLYQRADLQPFSDEIRKRPLLSLARYLLFRASNHLFDLKNELRRFIRTDGSALVLNTELLTDDEAALGIFQDLITEKVRAFGLRDGQSYANEVLNDCLYAVFADLGSASEQTIASFYPRGVVATGAAVPPPAEPAAALAAAPPAEPAAAPAAAPPAGAAAPAKREAGTVAAVAAEDQLELSEQIRIRNAVDSMIADLSGGDAFDTDRRVAPGRFVWKQAAATAFRYKRALEAHERALVTRLEALRAAVASFGTGGLLSTFVDLTATADPLVARLKDKVQEIVTGSRARTVDEAQKEILDWEREAAAPTTAGYLALLKRVADRAGLKFAPAAPGQDASLFLLETPFGDPRTREHRSGSAVLLALGEGGRLADDARAFVKESATLQRLAIVHVLHAPGEPGVIATREQKWHLDLGVEMSREVPDLGVPRVLDAKVIALDEGWQPADIATRWGDVLLQRLLFGAAWGSLARTPSWPASKDSAEPARLHGTADDQRDPESLIAVVRRWLGGQKRILCVVADMDVSGTLVRACVDVVRSPEIRHVVALPVPHLDPLDALSTQILRFAGGPPDKQGQIAALVADLIGSRELIPIVDATQPLPPDLLPGMLGDGGRAIVVAPASWEARDTDGRPLSTVTWTLQVGGVEKA